MFAPAGRPLIAASTLILAAACIGALLFPSPTVFVLLALAFMWHAITLWFFRDPDRSPAGPGIVSPADGKVVAIDTIHDSDLGESQRVAIFMSPFDVHVNRSPADCTIQSQAHKPGAYKPAFSKDAEENERFRTVFDTPQGPILTIQIAGWFARRIVAFFAPGVTLARGQRFGIIKFGSRVDVVLPAGTVTWQVKLGDRVKAGETILGTRP